MQSPRIVVLCGGTSPEREVSLGSGKASALALARSYATRLVDVRSDALPARVGSPPRRCVFHVAWNRLAKTVACSGYWIRPRCIMRDVMPPPAP
jgi:hypothetical protein